jgi:hypothetical protein
VRPIGVNVSELPPPELFFAKTWLVRDDEGFVSFDEVVAMGIVRFEIDGSGRSLVEADAFAFICDDVSVADVEKLVLARITSSATQSDGVPSGVIPLPG